jgi:hypothetical protein
VLAAAPLDTCYLALEADTAPATADRRASWLGS